MATKVENVAARAGEHSFKDVNGWMSTSILTKNRSDYWNANHNEREARDRHQLAFNSKQGGGKSNLRLKTTARWGKSQMKIG